MPSFESRGVKNAGQGRRTGLCGELRELLGAGSSRRARRVQQQMNRSTGGGAVGGGQPILLGQAPWQKPCCDRYRHAAWSVDWPNQPACPPSSHLYRPQQAPSAISLATTAVHQPHALPHLPSSPLPSLRSQPTRNHAGGHTDQLPPAAALQLRKVSGAGPGGQGDTSRAAPALGLDHLPLRSLVVLSGLCVPTCGACPSLAALLAPLQPCSWTAAPRRAAAVRSPLAVQAAAGVKPPQASVHWW
jgi:hypothetical protein